MDDTTKTRWLRSLRLALAVAALIGLGMWMTRSPEPARQDISYSQFYRLAEEGKIDRVSLRGHTLRGKLAEPTTVGERELSGFESRMPPNGDEALLPMLREKGVEVEVEATDNEGALWPLLIGILPWVLILGGWFWMMSRAQKSMGQAGGPGGPFASIVKHKAKRFDAEHSVPVRMADVAGMSGPKRELQEVIDFLKDATPFERLGVKIPRGVLLAGPPGTGKTLLARAVAGEAGVPFFSASGSDFIEMFVGVGASRVRELFAECKREAPAILFIDEIDAVGRARGTGLGGGHDEREQTLNQLLSEMDGFEQGSRVVVMAATNRPDVLDAALLRPGRFDRRVMLDLPARDARRAVLAVHVKDKPLAENVDLDGMARVTPGFSGADLANLANDAAMMAARRRADTIEGQDFDAALDKVLMGTERELVLSEKEKQRVAIHEGGHALVAALTVGADPPRRISIIPRGMALGVTQQRPENDRFLVDETELEAKLRVLLGGYVAERMVLGRVSTGAEDDLRKASDIARRMVAQYGMSEVVGPMGYELSQEHPFLGRRVASDAMVSDETIHTIEQEARALVLRAQGDAEHTLLSHREALDGLVTALLERETLDESDLDALLERLVHARPPLSNGGQVINWHHAE